MLVGNRAPYEAHHQATDDERTGWNQLRADHYMQAEQGVTVEEALRIFRSPRWQWPKWQ